MPGQSTRLSFQASRRSPDACHCRKGRGFKEALEPSFKVYQQHIIENARALADGLMRRGLKLVSGGTDTHLMLVDLRGTGVSGKDMQLRLV